MSYILVTKNTDPYINAATEEYLLKKFNSGDEPIIYLWQNDKTIVVGRNQNTFKQINLAAVQQNQINLFRRFSGGGTVYHDLGNLCYTLIAKTDEINRPDNYAAIAKPIVAFLNSLNIPAEFKGRNDLEIENKKISGNAQYLFQDKLLQHGTLMFDVNIDELTKYLNVDLAKIQAKGIDSIRKRVTNIKPYLPSDSQLNDINYFIEALTNWFITQDHAKIIELDDSAKQWIKDRANQHFKSWEWNYGKQDEYSFVNKKKYPGGLIEFNLTVDNGVVKAMNFYGDFLSISELDEIIPNFINQKFELKVFDQILSQINLEKYFGTITKEELLDLMFNNG